MKARTRLEVEVANLGTMLHEQNPLQDLMKDYAEQKVIERRAFATKNRVVCMMCGEKFSPDMVVRKRAICPHCGSKLKVEQSRKTTDKQEYYTAYIQIIGQYQVVRYFINYCYFQAKMKAKINTYEVLQQWIRDDGKCTYFGMCHIQNGYQDSWHGDFEIRKETGWYNLNKYGIYTEYYHPKSNIKECYSMYGIGTNLKALTFLQAIQCIPTEPRLETLLKAKQYQLLAMFCNRNIDRYWSAIKICLRNNYKVKNPRIWVDYIDLLMYFNKDTRNAHYVCPKDLNKEHDTLTAKKMRVERRREIENKKRRVAEYEKMFAELKAHLTGIQFQGSGILVKTLDSVQEYLQEGEKLRHCVYANEYFLKDDSICLSARIDNEPVETIEVALDTLEIVQCYGRCNQHSKHHDKIITLVQTNLPLIAERLKCTG